MLAALFLVISACLILRKHVGHSVGQEIQVHIEHFISVFADPLIRTLDLFLDDPEEFARRTPKRDANPILGSIVRTSDDEFRINVDPIQFATVANMFCSGQEFPFPLAFFALDNLSTNLGVPKAYSGAFGFYGLNSNLLAIPRSGGWLASAALGYRYFTDAYRDRIVELILRSSDGGLDTGTGFLMKFNDGKTRIVTCLHNLVEQKTGKIRGIESALSGSFSIAPAAGIALTRIDIAVLDTNIVGKDLPNANAQILETVFAAGFPRIYMTKPSPLLFHRGEVNGFAGEMEDASKEIILSIDVAPGNSGGPLFNQTGRVIGVVARKSETASESGMASYAHAIPIEVVRNELSLGNFTALGAR
jgi:hypothetical protein